MGIGGAGSGFEEARGFAFGGEGAAAVLFPEKLPGAADFENPPSARDQLDRLISDLFDFCRHTVGFGAVVSLHAEFDLNRHAREYARPPEDWQAGGIS